MKLTNKEADILAAVELRATLTVEEISAETGYRCHTIRHALSHLKQRHIISRLPLINVCALGLMMHNFVFSIGNGRKAVKQALLSALMAAPEVCRISELGSEYEYSLEICAKNICEVSSMLRRLTGKFENFLSRRAISTQFATTYLPRRYLTAKTVRSKPLQVLPSKVTYDIDELDDRILKALAADGEATRPAIARQLGIPLSTLELRIKKLEMKKIIAGYVYRVLPSEYKMQTYGLLIQAKRLSQDTLNKLYFFAQRHPAIVSISECFGSWDFELDVEVSQGEEVTKLTQDLYEVLGDEIHSIRSFPKYRDLKFQSYPCGKSDGSRMSLAA